VKDENGAENRGGGASDGAEVGADFETGEQTEKNDYGKRGDEGGEPPMAEGIVNLIPSHRQSSGGKWDSISMILNCLKAFELLELLKTPAGGRAVESRLPPPKLESMFCGC
jgi:hypothetical protein